MSRRKKPGRAKGRRNRGYFHRKGRGWFTSADEKLCDPQGNHLRDPDDHEAAALAYAHHCTEQAAVLTTPVGDSIVADVCGRYLEHARRMNADQTYRIRADLLFDFCSGFPPRFRERPDKATASDRIHPGYGNRLWNQLRKIDVEDWLAAHPRWKSTRVAVQAVSRAFNYCLEQGVIRANPVKGLKATRPGKRVTYFTPEVEEALYRFASPELALAIKVCIHTGARPICEFGRVEARHVQVDEKGNMVWWFSAKEAKVKSKPRVVRIARCIVPLVEEAMKKHPTGKLFRDPRGKPWTIPTMHCAFTKVRRKLLREKVPIDKSDVMYTCRHTYAKRMLAGYWTGKPLTIEFLAALMGNSPKVCWEHYAQWCDKYTEPLWESLAY
jgi:integrase